MRPAVIILASTVLQLLLIAGGSRLSGYMYDKDRSTTEIELVPTTTPVLSP
jgi:hypothetical protein